jgi:hypothetical protein
MRRLRYRPQIPPKQVKARIYRRDIVKFLIFDGTESHKEVYGIISTALRASETQGVDAARRMMKMLDKFEAVGFSETKTVKDPSNNEDVAVVTWKMKDAGGMVELEDAEFGDLRQRIDAMKWYAGAVKRVVATYDFLDACPAEKKAAVPKVRK